MPSHSNWPGAKVEASGSLSTAFRLGLSLKLQKNCVVKPRALDLSLRCEVAQHAQA